MKTETDEIADWLKEKFIELHGDPKTWTDEVFEDYYSKFQILLDAAYCELLKY